MDQTTGATVTEAQKWSAEGYQLHAGFVADLGRPVVTLLDPAPGERILDLGCGDGVLSRVIADAGAEVVGADASPDLLVAAAARGIETRHLDGQALPFVGEFDAVFSNAALHWMKDHDAVIAGVARALKPGGRFVGEFGGHGNVAAIVTALLAAARRHGVTPNLPWRFPTPSEWQQRLADHGFSIVLCELIPRPTPLPTGMAGWLETFANPIVDGLDQADKRAVLAEATELLSASLRDLAGNWTADYVRLRFAAQLG